MKKVDRFFQRGYTVILSSLIFFTCIELAFSAWLTAMYIKKRDYPSLTVRDRVRFTLFCCGWTLVFGIPLLLLFLLSKSNMFTSVSAHIIYLLLSWIMWTAAVVSVTEMLGGGLDCSTQKHFIHCGQLNALHAFTWVVWIITTIAVIAVIIRGIIVARRGDGYRGPLVDKTPT